MKKIFSVICIIMLIGLAACSNAGTNQNETERRTQATTEATTQEPGSDEQGSSEDATTENAGGTEDTTTTAGETSGTNILVAYFSATNTTETLAEYAADSLSADLYEITPVVPYTDADLDYGDDDSRSTKEMNDRNSRPEISGSVANMDQYDIVFVAYPIWWGEAPRIVSTFMESYDFAGKTVIPFCTSASSGFGSSGSRLEELTSGANWLDGRRFGRSASRSDIVSWINGLGLEVTAE